MEIIMTDFEKAQLMSYEIDRLRQEISIGARSMHRTIFVFLTAFVVIIGAYFGKELVHEAHKSVLVLLALLSIGIKNIRLGPNLPAFLSLKDWDSISPGCPRMCNTNM